MAHSRWPGYEPTCFITGAGAGLQALTLLGARDEQPPPSALREPESHEAGAPGLGQLADWPGTRQGSADNRSVQATAFPVWAP